MWHFWNITNNHFSFLAAVFHVSLLWFTVLCWHFLSLGIFLLPFTSYSGILFLFQFSLCLCQYFSFTTLLSLAWYFIRPLFFKQFSYNPWSPPPSLLPSSLTPLSEFTSPGHCEPGVYVWDPRESVCGDGEAAWWHAGDDPLQWERQTAWEAH